MVKFIFIVILIVIQNKSYTSILVRFCNNNKDVLTLGKKGKRSKLGLIFKNQSKKKMKRQSPLERKVFKPLLVWHF